MPDWYLAMKGAERLRVPFIAWIGMAAGPELPECVKQWTFAAMAAEGIAAKLAREHQQEEAKKA